MAKIKCAYIYLSDTKETDGTFSGSGGMVGFSSGGLGLGLGGVSGNTSQVTQSKLAEMFSPISNTQYSDLTINWSAMIIGLFLLYCGLNIDTFMPFFDGSVLNLSKSKETIKFILLVVAAGSLVQPVIEMQKRILKPTFKYSAEQYEKITERYNKIDYNTDDNTLELDNVIVTASRENFIKLCENNVK